MHCNYFKDLIFMDDKLPAKAAKITSLKNLYVYSNYFTTMIIIIYTIYVVLNFCGRNFFTIFADFICFCKNFMPIIILITSIFLRSTKGNHDCFMTIYNLQFATGHKSFLPQQFHVMWYLMQYLSLNMYILQ